MKSVCYVKAAVMLGLVGAAAGVARGQCPATPYPVNVTGATLFESFFGSAPQATNDFIDANGDGHARSISCGLDGSVQQLAPLGVQPTQPWWAVQYRSTGSGNGLAELVNWGTRFTTNPLDLAQQSSTGLDNGYCNRVKFWDGSGGAGATAIWNGGNPGALPYRSDSDPLSLTYNQGTYAAPNTGSCGGVRMDTAIMDVPTTWFITQSGTAGPTLTPMVPGYGNYGRVALNPNGSVQGQSNKLKSLTSTVLPAVTLNLNSGSPDQFTVFDSPVAAAPIAFMANYGSGKQQMTYTELRHLFATGRLPSGENLTAITRDSGSGTRNGAMNSLGLDPSWGAGENVGAKNDDNAGVPAGDRSLVGPNYLPSNKGGSGSLERTVRNTRLGIGTSGAERGKTQNWLAQHQTELLGVKNDLGGGTVYARPTLNNLLDNDLNGYNIEGPETFASIGDPRAASAADGGTGWCGAFDPFVDLNNNGLYDLGEPFTDLNGNGIRDASNAEAGLTNTHPQVRNRYAAQYLNNITRSIQSFVSFGPNQADFTPGEYLAFNFILVAATDYVPNPTDPKNILPNPALNQFLQDQIRANNTIFKQPYYNAYDNSFAGIPPVRTPLTVGTYTDGSTGLYVKNGTGGSSTIPSGGQLPLRNKIQGDFNGDGVRDINDICDMVSAWRRYNTAGVWNAPDGAFGTGSGADFSIDLMGDFNNDGKFDAKDIRFMADGLALNASGNVDRRAAFIRVDTCFGGNFFGTTQAHGTYANGNSRADIAGAVGTTPGYAPVGADGVINAADIDYVYKQFKQNPATGGGPAHWNILTEAGNADLSADITGDLIVDQNDVIELVQTILGTSMGDVNLDGTCDATDLAIASAHLGQPGGWAVGDVDGDGVVTAADIAIISACAPHCGSADFNCDGDVGTDADIEAFFACLAGACPSAPCTSTADFNADGDIGTDADIEAFFRVLGGGTC
jgi:hypothetical protein